MSQPLFLSDPGAPETLRRMARRAVDALEPWARPTSSGPRSPVDPTVLAAVIDAVDPCPPDGRDFAAVLDDVTAAVLVHGVRTFDPHCVAHLHSPTLLSAAASELIIGATNQSMDSFDQAPAATLVEDHLVRWLAASLGLPATATGVLTAGGTASNLLGLVLAREHAGAGDVAEAGLPPEAADWRIVTSAAAHFSIERAASVLGLGRRAVVAVPTDAVGRIDLAALDAALEALADDGRRVIAVVGTAGTTDHGAIDPLVELAERAAALGAWFHVDAAVGAAFCLSDRLRPWLAGLDRADSVTADLHKLWWQPIGASVLLVRDAQRLAALRQPSEYLDRDDDPGGLNLVGRSLDTSRRFDALKVLVSLRSTGRRRLGALVEHLVDTTSAIAAVIEGEPDLELLAPPASVTVLFRWRPHGGDGDDKVLDNKVQDRANAHIQRHLFETGQAVLGRTRLGDRVSLKLTLVNPRTTVADLTELLTLVRTTGGDWMEEALEVAR